MFSNTTGVTIYGYADSTASAQATTYGLDFVALDDDGTDDDGATGFEYDVLVPTALSFDDYANSVYPYLYWTGGGDGDKAFVAYYKADTEEWVHSSTVLSDKDGNAQSLQFTQTTPGTYTKAAVAVVEDFDGVMTTTMFDAIWAAEEYAAIEINVTITNETIADTLTLTQGTTTSSGSVPFAATGLTAGASFRLTKVVGYDAATLAATVTSTGSATVYDSSTDGVWYFGIGAGNADALDGATITAYTAAVTSDDDGYTLDFIYYTNIGFAFADTDDGDDTTTTPTTYAITSADTTNGSFEVSATTAEAETEITITPAANSGYEVDTVTVTGASGNVIDVTDNTFVMPEEAVTVSVTFKEIVKTAQSVVLGEIEAKTYGDEAFTLSASGYEGTGAITYESSDESVIIISGTTATVVDSGMAIITVTIAEDDDYFSATASQKVVVNQATITITADNQSAYKGYSEPTYTYTVAGLKGDDQLTTDPKVICPDADMTTNGTYSIVASGATADGNYIIEYVEGTLTVTTKSSSSSSSSGSSSSSSSSDTTDTTTTETTTATTTTDNVTVESTTETTTNNDGSTTTETVETATNEDTGEVVATIKTETSVENEDGSVTTAIASTSTNETTGEVTVTTATATTTLTDDGATVTETVAVTTNETSGDVTESVSTETVSDTAVTLETQAVTTTASGDVIAETVTVIADTETATEITATVATENGETTAAQIIAVATDDTIDVTIPQEVLVAVAAEEAATITVQTADVEIVLDPTATNTVADALATATEEQVVITAVAVESAVVSDTITADLNNIVVVDLTISVGGETVSNFNGGTATVSIPYTPINEVAPITVYYVADDGSVTLMPCTYDAETGMVVFETTHFSYYMLSENDAIAFTDVAVNAYYYEAVKWAVEYNVISGYSDGTFRPIASCTRAQAVTFLWRAAGEPEATIDNPFTDLDETAYYYDAVLWAVENGITTGYEDGTFRPNTTCNRGAIVTFLYRFAGEPDVTGEAEEIASDVASGAYYYDAVLWAVENGITTGYADGTFRPSTTCNRGAIVTFLYRYLVE